MTVNDPVSETIAGLDVNEAQILYKNRENEKILT